MRRERHLALPYRPHGGTSQMNHTAKASRGRIALLWRGDPNSAEKPTVQNNRLYPLFEAFADLNLEAEPIVYADEIVHAVRERLLRSDGVLVWVDPITEGKDRSQLDLLLREVSAQGVWVSAHPDVILKIGTKEVLFHTRHLGWGTDTCLYRTAPELKTLFPRRLASSGPRVLKQRRGNGGIGTWRVELVSRRSEASHDPVVRVREARRGGSDEEMRLHEFMQRCETYFSDSGCLVDQPFQERVAEGMIRCYLVHNQVAGFSTQAPSDEKSGFGSAAAFSMARHKTMYEESEPRFQTLRDKMEAEWVPALQQLFTIDTDSLPAIWDADFLYGPKNSRGEDTYVLCEINVSAVFPFPETAVARIAEAAMTRAFSARKARAKPPA